MRRPVRSLVDIAERMHRLVREFGGNTFEREIREWARDTPIVASGRSLMTAAMIGRRPGRARAH